MEGKGESEGIMKMKTYENSRIRVTVSDKTAAEFNNDRGEILSHAMMVLGNQSEAALLAAEMPDIDQDEILAEARTQLVYDYLAENCRYNLAETLMRMSGGHRMSAGMQADVSAAHAHAERVLRSDDAKQYIDSAIESINKHRKFELDYRNSRANKPDDMDIEIIGEMPAQIGTCRYLDYRRL